MYRRQRRRSLASTHLPQAALRGLMQSPPPLPAQESGCSTPPIVRSENDLCPPSCRIERPWEGCHRVAGSCCAIDDAGGVAGPKRPFPSGERSHASVVNQKIGCDKLPASSPPRQPCASCNECSLTHATRARLARLSGVSSARRPGARCSRTGHRMGAFVSLGPDVHGPTRLVLPRVECMRSTR
jgi:hypothetical protein